MATTGRHYKLKSLGWGVVGLHLKVMQIAFLFDDGGDLAKINTSQLSPRAKPETRWKVEHRVSPARHRQ